MTSRLIREYREIQDSAKTDGDDVELRPNETDLFQCTAFLRGPSETPFEGGRFEVLIRIPKEYPISPPKAYFKTRIFHPNVHFKTGEICLDILKSSWSPAWGISSVARAILALLSCPEADSPLNCDAGNLIRAGDMRGYTSMARMYTRLYATVPAVAASAADGGQD